MTKERDTLEFTQTSFDWSTRMYFLLFVASLGLFHLGLTLHGNVLYRSLCGWFEAGDRFREWKDENPHVYIGLSDKGKALLTALITAYDNYLHHHPYVDDNGHREYLMSLFDDLPPLWRKPLPRNKFQNPAKAGF